MQVKKVVEEYDFYGKHPGIDKFIKKHFKSEKWRYKAWVFVAHLRKIGWIEKRTRGPLQCKYRKVYKER